MEPERLKHLEFLQNVISRMNTNSFQIKGMTVTISAALLAVYASTQKPVFIQIGLLPIIVFWFLDAYYRTQERKFRGLYDDIAGLSPNNPQIKIFSMNTTEYKDNRYSYFRVLFSHTIWVMYIPLLLIMIILFLILR